ncbi:hypothetical protein [Sphingomonas abietis]|uniref:DUF4189 domain-containing protein n=1 Tax=Sphingomonas abietis TaxID=3012344 RepID=A0ABY7NNJ1_9SPHN|nr:hypothetical protein [Sphingomonas abietis]WBO23094.1 hypothetical protein PBT88_02840 [Sphingomonas abietis]
MPAFAAVRSIAIAVVGFLFGLMLAALALPIAARAEAPKATATAPAAPAGTAKQPVDNDAKTISIVVYGDDACPQSNGDEIVVCAREPEGERYRIPKRFRGKKAEPAVGNSWANKNRSLDDAGRMAAGIPDTCSAVGTGGQSGCYSQFLGQAAAAQRQRKQDQSDSPDGIPQN